MNGIKKKIGFQPETIEGSSWPLPPYGQPVIPTETEAETGFTFDTGQYAIGSGFLSQLKQQESLTGRPLSEIETSELFKSYWDTAQEEAGALRKELFEKYMAEESLKLQEESLELQEEQADGGLCMIVTCCNGRDSYEVEVSRKYRILFTTKEILRGYYSLAESIIPFLQKHETIKDICRVLLVKSLVDYAEMKLNIKTKCRLMSNIVSKGFIKLCSYIGTKKGKFTRSNGEVI